MKARITLGGAILRVFVLAGLVFSLVPQAGAQMPAVKARVAAVKSQPATAAKPAGGPQEGIKVHGHWTIVVRDMDGKEVTRREFDNALVDSGKGLLAALLSRQVTFGEWAIQLSSSSGALIGIIVEPTNSQNIQGLSKTLAVNFLQALGGTGAASVELKGNTQAMASQTINFVETWALTTQGGGAAFTKASLQSPPSVTAGQFIEVTVTLSFS